MKKFRDNILSFIFFVLAVATVPLALPCLVFAVLAYAFENNKGFRESYRSMSSSD